VLTSLPKYFCKCI